MTWHWLGILNPARLVRGFKTAANLELYQRLESLHQDNDRLRAERDHAREETAALRAELVELRTQRDQRATYEQEGNLLWRGSGRTSKDGPICKLCMDEHGIEVFMTPWKPGHVACMRCKKNTVKVADVPPTPARPYSTPWVSRWTG